MGRGSRLQLDIVQEKNDTDFCRVLQGGIIRDQEYQSCDFLKGGLSLSFF